MKIINSFKNYILEENSKNNLSYYSKTLLVLQSLLVFSIVAFDNWNFFHLLTYVFLAASILLIALRFIIKKQFPATDYKIFYFILFYFYSTIVTFFGSKAYGGLITSFGAIVLIFTSYYTNLLVNNYRKTLLSFILPILMFSFLFCAVYRNQIFSLDFSNRLGSFFSNENTISIAFNLGFFVSIIYVFFGTKKSALMLPIPLFFAFCSLFTGSRKGVLMFLITLLIVVFIRFWRKKIVIVSFLIAIAAIIIVFFTVPVLAPIRDRLIGTIGIFVGGTSAADGSSALRYRMLLESIFDGLDGFWLGRGIDGFRMYTIYGTYSHNNFGEMIYNFGIIGFLLYHLPFLICCFNSKKDSISKSYVFGFISIIILFSFSSVFYYDKLLAIFIGLLIISTDVNGIFDKRKIEDNYYSFEV